MSGVNLDDFTEDFEGALDTLTQDTIARVDRDTAGMSDLQVNDYFLKRALAHLAEMRKLDAPECIVEMAERNVARLEAKRDALTNR